MKIVNFKINIFLFSLFIIKTHEYECSSYRECFNCYHCDTYSSKDCNCVYDTSNNKCSIIGEYNFISQSESSEEIFDYIFKTCNNSNTNNEMSYYCGEVRDLHFESDKTITISPPNINGLYGKKNLYCKFTFHVKNKDDKANEITLSLKSDENVVQNLLYFEFKDGSTQTYSNEYDLEIKMKNVFDFIFYFYIKEKSSETPFSIIVKNKYSKLDLILIITIVILTITLIVIIASIIVLYKRMTRREEEQNQNQSHKSKKKQAKAIIEKFFEENGLLSPQKYTNDFEKKYGNSCTICLENFKVQNSNVCITPCNHIFHKDCLYDWLHDNIDKSKCPNCNQQFITTNEEGDYVINPKIINITSKEKKEDNNTNRNEFVNEEVININNNIGNFNNNNNN